MRNLQPGRGPSPDHVGTLILDFRPPELRGNFLLFINHSVCGVLLRQPEWTNTAQSMKTLGSVESQGKLQSGPVSSFGERVEQQGFPRCWSEMTAWETGLAAPCKAKHTQNP